MTFDCVLFRNLDTQRTTIIYRSSVTIKLPTKVNAQTFGEYKKSSLFPFPLLSLLFIFEKPRIAGYARSFRAWALPTIQSWIDEHIPSRRICRHHLEFYLLGLFPLLKPLLFLHFHSSINNSNTAIMTSMIAKYISKKVLGETMANNFGKDVSCEDYSCAADHWQCLRTHTSRQYQQQDLMDDLRARARRGARLYLQAYQSMMQRFSRRSKDELIALTWVSSTVAESDLAGPVLLVSFLREYWQRSLHCLQF